MKEETIAVIIPVYNVEEYLEECLSSIINQTIKFDEVILVNDGSTDNSKDICERYCNNVDYFRLIDQNNQGLAMARNNGLKYVTSKYVMFVDSDDYIALDTVETLQAKLKQDKMDVLFFSAEMRYDVEIADRRNMCIRKTEWCYQSLSGMDFLVECFPDYYVVSACMAVYNRKFLEDYHILFPKGVYYEDNFFSLQIMHRAKRIECIPNRLYIRRYREDSIMTSSVTEKKCHDMVAVHELIWKYIHDVIKPEAERFWAGFISHGIVNTIAFLKRYYGEEPISDYETKLVECFYKYCSPLFKGEELTVDMLCAILLVNIRTKKICLEDTGWKEETMEDAETLREKIREYIDAKLAGVPFEDRSKKIAIYGIGNHTKWLMKYIERYHGGIAGKIYFIVTNRTQASFMGHEVMDVSELKKDIDVFVVSSKVYQEAMKERLIEEGIAEEKIVLLYKEKDVLDLVMIGPVLLGAE